MMFPVHVYVFKDKPVPQDLPVTLGIQILVDVSLNVLMEVVLATPNGTM